MEHSGATLPEHVLKALDEKIENFFRENTYLDFYGPEDQARMREAMRDAGIEDLKAYAPILAAVWDNAIEFFEDNYYGEITSASDYNPFNGIHWEEAEQA